MKKLRILYIIAALAILLCGCAGQKTVDDGPKPWAAPSTQADQTQAQTEWTKQAEMSTLAMLETDGASITLPQGVTAADVEQLEHALWMPFFYHALTPDPVATAQDVLPYLTNGAVPWGLFYLYDTFDPAHTHGEYEKLSVVEKPDPLAQFPDEYYRVDQTVLQFLFGDVFQVRTDLTFADDGYYFADGFGYFNCLPTGMEGYETHVRACQTASDGQYRITAELLIAQDAETMSHAASAFVDASVVEKDGLRYWAIHQVEPFE